MAAFSSRLFNQDVGAAKRAAKDGPVFITDRGRPAHVLMTIEEYRKLTGARTIVEMLAIDGEENPHVFDSELERARSRELPRLAEFD